MSVSRTNPGGYTVPGRMKLLDAAYAAGLLLGSPYIGARMLVDARYRDALGERFGRGAALPEAECRVWFHGASAGEILAVQPLYRIMKDELPGFDAVFSAATYTGRTMAAKKYPDGSACYLPIDMGWCVRKALARVKPRLVVLVEGDIWPNFICAARAAGARVVVVNGRFSRRSVARYGRFGAFFRPAFQAIDLVCLRDDVQAANIVPLGIPAEKQMVTGNVKYDNLKTQLDDTRSRVGRTLNIADNDRVVVGGSTHAGEEGFLLDLFAARKDFRLVIVPRYPHRVPEVAALVREKGLSSVAYSEILAGAAVPSRKDVVLIDTVGDLAGMYQIATVAFVGGSLIPRGGQNMLEPAALGVPVLYGPHTWVFVEDVAMLREASGGIEVPDGDALGAELGRLLDNPSRREGIGRRAREAILKKSGASRLTFGRIRNLLFNKED